MYSILNLAIDYEVISIFSYCIILDYLQQFLELSCGTSENHSDLLVEAMGTCTLLNGRVGANIVIIYRHTK